MNAVPPFPIVSGATALLVLDVFRFTVVRDEGLGRMARERGIEQEMAEYYEQLDQVVPNIIRLVDGCRAHRVPVVFTRLVARSPQDAGPQARVTGFWATTGTVESEFLASRAPAPDDTVIDRTATSAFCGTDLHARLQRRGMRYLIICGVLATGAVDLTARDAADLGYGVIVTADACAADTWAAHGFVMPMLVGGLIRTRSVQAVLEMLDGSRT